MARPARSKSVDIHAANPREPFTTADSGAPVGVPHGRESPVGESEAYFLVSTSSQSQGVEFSR